MNVATGPPSPIPDQGSFQGNFPMRMLRQTILVHREQQPISMILDW